MNLDLKRALIRAAIIALLVIAFLAFYVVEAGTASTEPPAGTTEATDTSAEEATQEPPAATETATASTEEQEPDTETEPATAHTAPQETCIATETTHATNEPTEAAEPPTEQPATLPETTGSWQSLGTYKLTAYCSCQTCCGQYALNRPTDENGNPIVYTSIGAIAKAGVTIAVDPSIIPYGSSVKINEHIYIAQDTGGAIKGNRIDVYFDDHQDALQFGVQTAEVFLQIEAA